MREQLEKNLLQVYNECQNPNWDGYGAESVTSITLEYAKQFLNILPEDVLIADLSVCADPDGDISFDWYWGPFGTISISISAEGKLCYAALYGDEKIHGVEIFNGVLPKKIKDLIHEINKRYEI